MTVTTDDIRRLLAEEGLGAEPAIGDRESLFDAGALDSLRLMTFVTRLESEFGIRIGPDDLAPENFETIDAIAAYVSRRAAASVA